jgi:phosphoribosylamine---glycine ligase
VTALGSTLEAARARAYEAVSRIHFENCQYRRDIALGDPRNTGLSRP